MAGSASNWYKVSAGPLKGQTVYISKKQRGGFTHAGMQDRLDAGSAPAVKIANTAMPKGVAKKAPASAQAPVKHREFSGISEAADFARAHYKAWGDGISAAHDSALGQYQGGSSKLNRGLRGSEERRPLDIALTDRLDAALAATPPLKEPITVYRGMPLVFDEAKALLNSWQVGGEYGDPGFLSTSLDKNTAWEEFGVGGVTMELRLPAGQKAAYMQARQNSPSRFDHEQELLLPRDTRYRIVSKEMRPKGGAHVVLEVI